ncbi:hypothetical protein [Amycolatopsis nigrescens]|uniref:hypothetical protein n=1 Tax=Amycolatopsis nigrescens TaxID=381445 RepID=UPI0012F891F8|nr:hypothetical protein [Amycolatopsis nigrescens]
MESTAIVRRTGRMLPRHATRLLIVAGLSFAGWLLALLLSPAASADEPTLPGDQSGSGQTETSAGPLPAENSGTDTITNDADSTGSADNAKTETPEQPAQSEPESGSSETGETTAATEATASRQTESEPAAQRKRTAPQPAAGGGLLGLVGNTVNGVLGVVGNTVGGVLNTVGAVSDAVLSPITRDCPPAELPDLLPQPGPVGDAPTPGHSGGGVTIAVPADQRAELGAHAGTQPGDQPQPVIPGGDADRPEAPAPVQTQRSSSPAQNHQARSWHAPAAEHQQAGGDVEANAGGGSSGGGQLPSAPSALMVAPCAASPGHDNSGGGRQQLGVTTSTADTTQLQLIGTSRQHSADGAGRDAALPTASPD